MENGKEGVNMIVLSTKLKNAIKKNSGDMDLKFTLKNISINGRKTGCSGFVRNMENNSVIYVDTEEPCLSNLHYMYRYADGEKDYTGYHNRWSKTLEDLALNICKCLGKTPKEANDFRI